MKNKINQLKKKWKRRQKTMDLSIQMKRRKIKI